MGQVLLDIKNEEKAKFLLDFLKQIDFVEIKKVFQKDDKERGGGRAKIGRYTFKCAGVK